MRKRFIAGAVCPRCGQMDRLVSYTPEGTDAPVRECVACGFSEQLRMENTEPLITRVNRGAEKKVAPLNSKSAHEQVIRFIPLPKKKP